MTSGEGGPVAAEEVLAVLRATAFAPGSNVRGERAGAPWSFLLPTMEPGRVLVLGRPDPATERTLRRLSSAVEIRDPGEDAVADGAFGLVAVVTTPGGGVAARTVVARAARHVAPGGALILLATGAGAGAAISAAADDGLEVRLDGEARPVTGELVAALSGGEPQVGGLVARLAIVPRRASTPIAVPGWVPHRFVPHARAALRIRRRIVAAATDRLRPPPADRQVIVLRRPTGPSQRAVHDSARPPDPLPDWLGTLARTAGHDLAGRPWAFVARGDYDSQKPVFVIADPSGSQPELVVKVTRNPVWNGRLGIEERALRRLEPTAGDWRDLVIPRVAFSGTHAGLAALGETAVAGRPYAAAAAPDERETAFRAAVDGLIELGRSTRRAATGAAHAAAIEPLVARFAAIWSIDAPEAAALRRDLDAIAAAPELPAVAIHGDAGTHNMLITESGRIALLDWEASEAAGPPLWDLERLAGSRAAHEWVGRRPVSMADRARRHLIDGSSLTPTLAEAVRRYAEALAIPDGLIAPLIRMAWVARALKEVNRLRPGELERGHHRRLVRLSITADGAGWRTLTRGSGR